MLFIAGAWVFSSQRRKPARWQGPALALVFAGLTLLVLELAFYSLVAESDGWGFTLSHKRYLEKYWGPVNSMGLRDREHKPEDFNGKRVLFVVGDSITAGQGLKDYPNERYSDILAKNLGADHVVVNMARNGWNATDYNNALRHYPFQKPDTIVVGYCLNDFEAAWYVLGLENMPEWVRASPKAQLDKKFYAPLVNNSYLVNFLYWRIYRKRRFDISKKYLDYLHASYADPRVWTFHRRELDRIADYARERDAKLLVAVFPLFGDVRGSADLTARVASYLHSRGVAAIDTAPAFKDKPARDLVANPYDGHPGPAAHKIIAGLILDELETN